MPEARPHLTPLAKTRLHSVEKGGRPEILIIPDPKWGTDWRLHALGKERRAERRRRFDLIPSRSNRDRRISVGIAAVPGIAGRSPPRDLSNTAPGPHFQANVPNTVLRSRLADLGEVAVFSHDFTVHFDELGGLLLAERLAPASGLADAEELGLAERTLRAWRLPFKALRMHHGAPSRSAVSGARGIGTP